MIKNLEVTRKPSYAEKLKIPRRDPVVILQPKNTQHCSATKADLIKYIDPKSILISDVNSLPNGGLAINCESTSETVKLRDIVVNRMSENYDIPSTEKTENSNYRD